MAFPLSPTSVEDRSQRERWMGRLTGRLGPEGYVVHADGVVVGPTGIAVVTALACADRLRVHDGELWHGRFPLRGELAKGRRAVDEVRSAAARHRLGVPLRWFACALGTDAPVDPYCTLDVEVLAPADLPGRIEAAPPVLEFEEVLRLAHHLDPARRRRSAWRSSRWPRR